MSDLRRIIPAAILTAMRNLQRMGKLPERITDDQATALMAAAILSLQILGGGTNHEEE